MFSLNYLTEPTFTLAPIINAWIQLPGTKEIDLYETATASVIVVIDSGQPSDDDARGLSTGVCQYRRGGSCRASRTAAQSSFIHTDIHPQRSSVRVCANIEEVDHAELAEKLHRARSSTLIHIRQGPVHERASGLPEPALI